MKVKKEKIEDAKAKNLPYLYYITIFENNNNNK